MEARGARVPLNDVMDSRCGGETFAPRLFTISTSPLCHNASFIAFMKFFTRLGCDPPAMSRRQIPVVKFLLI